jgi:catechol 2,3-dioxygenase-like lactoylglutathione lyase family enzyme
MPVPEPTQPTLRMAVAHFIVSADVERSRRFYTEVLGGTEVFGPAPTYVALANGLIIINAGGGPTDDKPTVTLETPADPDRVSSFLNIRVEDIHAVYAEWSARGAVFLTPPKQHQYEIRCYVRDPDDYLIEVGQTTDPQGDWWPSHWPTITASGDSGPSHHDPAATAAMSHDNSSLDVDLPGDSELVVEPREARAETVVVSRHEEVPSGSERCDDPVQLLRRPD